MCQILCAFSPPILFINFAYTLVNISIQCIIFPSRHTANTRLFWLFSSIATCLPPKSFPIQPSHQVPSADHARNSTPSRHASQTRESVTPCTLKPVLDISQMHDPQPFDLPGWPNCPFMRGSTNPPFVRGIESPFIVLHSDLLISPHNPKSRVYDLVPTHRAKIQHGPLHN